MTAWHTGSSGLHMLPARQGEGQQRPAAVPPRRCAAGGTTMPLPSSPQPCTPGCKSVHSRSQGKQAGRVCNFKRGAVGELAGLMAAPSSNGAIRKALRQFEDGLQTFCGQLATETAEVGAPAGCRTAPEAQSTQECDRSVT